MPVLRDDPPDPVSADGARPRVLHRLLHALARVAVTRPWTLLLGATLPALGLSALVLRAPLDLSFGGVMDRSHPEVARYFEASRRYGLGGRLPLLLEGPEEALDGAAEALIRGLEDDPSVRSVVSLHTSTGDPWVVDHLPYLVDPRTFELWTAQISAADESGAEELRERLERPGQGPARPPPQGSRLLLVTLARDSFDADLAAQDFPALERKTAATLSPHAVSGRYAGMPAIVHQDQEATLGRIQLLSIASLLAALALILRIERRPLGLAAIAAPMLLATGATLGLVGLLAGTITLMESIFSVMIFGLGIDFAVHLSLRLQEEEKDGAPFPRALSTALQSAGPGVIAGALTTAGAFAIVAFAPDASFFHLGLAGGLGITLCLLLALALLPAAWSLMARRRSETRAQPQAPPLTPTAQAPSIWTRALGATIAHARRRPRLHVGVAALLVIAGVAGLPRLHFESDLRRIVNRQVDAVAVADRIHERFGEVPNPWIVPTQDLAQARRLAAALEAEPAFGRTRSAADLIPEDAASRHAQLDALGPALERAAQGPPELAELAQGLMRAHRSGPPTLSTLPPELAEQLIADDGRPLLYAFPSAPHLSARISATERGIIRELHPEATSMGALFEVLIGADRPWAPLILALVGAFVALVLLIDLRRLSWVLLAITPVCIGAALTAGALCWANVAFNTVTLLGLPLIVGLGVDDGIHVVHRLRDAPADREVEALTGVARAIGTTTATTCASFAVLLASGHPGMESLALVMLLGLPVCLGASVSTLPALAKLLGVRRRRPGAQGSRGTP